MPMVRLSGGGGGDDKRSCCDAINYPFAKLLKISLCGYITSKTAVVKVYIPYLAAVRSIRASFLLVSSTLHLLRLSCALANNENIVNCFANRLAHISVVAGRSLDGHLCCCTTIMCFVLSTPSVQY